MATEFFAKKASDNKNHNCSMSDSEHFDEEERYSLEDQRVDTKSKNDEIFLAKDIKTGKMLGRICATKVGPECGFISPCFLNKGEPESSESSRDLLRRNLQLEAENSLEGRNIVSLVKSSTVETPSGSDVCVSEYSGFPSVQAFKAPLRSGYGIHICHAQMVPEDDLVEFDKKIVGFNRRLWIRHFLNHSNNSCCPEIPSSVSLVVTRTNGRISAWGTIRPGKETYKLGPLYAEDEQSARLLLRALVDSSPGARKFGLDAKVLSEHSTASQLMKEISLCHDSTKERCLVSKRQEKLDFIDYKAVYALSNFETQYI